MCGSVRSSRPYVGASVGLLSLGRGRPRSRPKAESVGLGFCSENAVQGILARVGHHWVDFSRYFGAQIDHIDTNRKQSFRLCGS
jgi:hypothetical protein